MISLHAQGNRLDFLGNSRKSSLVARRIELRAVQLYRVVPMARLILVERPVPLEPVFASTDLTISLQNC